MTTIIGIKTSIDEEAVVLASDTQMNYYDKDGESVIEKRPLLKIVYGDFWALAPCGACTSELLSFYNRLKNPGDKRYKEFSRDKLLSMINRAIEKKRFIEIDELNANYVREENEFKQAHEFLMAVNKPKLELFHIDIFGNLKIPEKNCNYIVLGSGRKNAINYLEDKIEGDTYDSSNIDIGAAIKLCREALKKAWQDIYTGLSMDLVVVRKDKVSAYGKEIKEAVEKAEEKAIEDIILSLKK